MAEFKIPGLKEAISEVQALRLTTSLAAKELLDVATNADKAMQAFKGSDGLKQYIELQKKSEETQKKTAESAAKFADAQAKLNEKTRLLEIKLQQEREKAFDNFEKNINKQIALKEKEAARNEALAAKELARIEKEVANAVKASEKIIAQKEKELVAAEKAANKYEADLAKKAIAEEKSAQQTIKNAEKARLEELRLQKAREKSVDDFTKNEAKAAAAAAKTAEELIRNSRAYVILNKQRTEASNRLRDLVASETASNAQIRAAQKEFDGLSARVRKADMAVGDFTKNVGNYPQMFNNIGSGLKNLLGAFGFVGGIAAFAGIMKGAYDTVKKFEQGVADLSAITGASGKDLDYLKNSAIELGKKTAGGAIAVVEAYKLIASAKPELLDNVKALNQVTEATITLAQASGLELPDAASRLTDAMNQFGAPAEKAGQFIDVLANASKYGAAEIPQVTDALLKFGAVARTSNVSIEESAALIEVLAENGLKGADAGTALRNVMLKISAPDALPRKAQEEIRKLGVSFEFLSDKSIPFQKKLEALAPLAEHGGAAVKTFGFENVTAALNVLQHTDRLAELTEKMYDVGTATEQAEIRMNTLSGKTEKLSSTYDSLVLSIGQGSGVVTNFFKFFVDGSTDAINALIRLNTSWDELYGKAKESGQARGAKDFQSNFNKIRADQANFVNNDPTKGTVGVKGAGAQSDEAIAQNIKDVAEQNYKDLEKKFAENKKNLDALEKDGEGIIRNITKKTGVLGYAIQAAYDPLKDARKENERLTEELNKQASIIREAKSVISPKKTAADPAGAAGIPGVLTPEQLKEAEANARKLEAIQKKSAEAAIRTMKLTLDNLIEGYQQEEHLDEENVAHVRAISDLKIEIANAEMRKNLIGVKKGSIDEQEIIEGNSQAIEKIYKERANAINKILITRERFELEIYDLTHKTLLDGSKNLTDELVAEERSRMEQILAVHKEYMRKQLGIDEDTTDEKLRMYARTGAQLTENELKYLKFIEKEDKETDDSIKKNYKDLVDYKIKQIEKEADFETREYALKEKSAFKNRVFQNRETDKKLKKEREAYEKEQENLEEGSAAYEENADKIKDIDLRLAENKQMLTDMVSESTRRAAQQGLELLTQVAGEESDIGKTAAIAQTTINTYEGASRAYKDYPYPFNIAVAALITAKGLQDVAKISGVELFYKGTDNAPYTGKGIKDEFGPELHFDKNWNLKSFGSDGGAHLTDIVQGDKIVPADISKSMLSGFAATGKVSGSLNIDYGRVGEEFGKHADKIVKAVRSSAPNINISIPANVDSEMSAKGKVR